MKAGDVINDVGREDDGDNYGHWMLCMAGPDDTVVPTEGCEWYYDCSSDDLYQPIQGMVSLSRHSHHHCGFMFAFGCDYCCPLSDKKAETALSSTHFEEESHERREFGSYNLISLLTSSLATYIFAFVGFVSIIWKASSAFNF